MSHNDLSLLLVANHYDRNRQHSRESGLGAKTARVIEEEEKQAYLSKQLNFYQQKQKMYIFTECFLSNFSFLFISFSLTEKKMIRQ